MIDTKKTESLIETYLPYFNDDRWEQEGFKWQAIKTFQDNFDINATDFKSMLDNSLRDATPKRGSLLDSSVYFPKTMLLHFCEKGLEEKVRSMFKNLYDESGGVDVVDRILDFIKEADECLKAEQYWVSHNSKSFQDLRSVSVYLWLRYPDKYYIYRPKVVKLVAEAAGEDYKKIKKSSDHPDKDANDRVNLRNFYKLYSSINDLMRQNTRCKEVLSKHLDDSCYPDPYLVTMTIDLGQWIREKKQSGKKGEQNNSANEEDASNESQVTDGHNEFPEGENSKAGLATISGKPNGYWWLNCNPLIWQISACPIGEKQTYSLFNQNGNPRRIQRNFENVRVGDPVIGYETTPVKKVVALAVITRASDEKTIEFQKVEGLANPVSLKEIQDNEALAESEPMKGGQGSLFSLTPAQYEELMDLIRDKNPEPEETPEEIYNEDSFLGEVYLSKEGYEDLVGLLGIKKNVILCGAPGVGKTFAAKRLAYSMLGKKNGAHIQMVQFHQSYSYEDFVQGYKPVEGGGFELRNGIFYDFCQKAAQSPNEKFFFIIDEINRGNLSKIFGELLMLIEASHRNEKIKLAYSDNQFWVPENLYIIGMMNTADRSLAMMDYALRRRFAFFKLSPAFDNPGFKTYQASLKWQRFNDTVEMVKSLNRDITADSALGDGFQIGHSYFCNFVGQDEKRLDDVILYEIIPLLEEYWMDDREKLEGWENKLRSLING